jgi:dCTP deaminase
VYLSNRDIQWAIECGQLIVRPKPEDLDCGYDETSIDLHLDKVEEARVWDVALVEANLKDSGVRAPELHLGSFNWTTFSDKYLIDPPLEARPKTDPKPLVYRRSNEIVVLPNGFLLWTTKEVIGTPTINPRFVCFVNAKSTKARTGLMVHMTAPTIHAGWDGNITLEIANLGPFHFVLKEDDVIAQLTVAAISSPPDLRLKKQESKTAGQAHASGKRRKKSK